MENRETWLTSRQAEADRTGQPWMMDQRAVERAWDLVDDNLLRGDQWRPDQIQRFIESGAPDPLAPAPETR